jgi:polar amino acid transport system permease protein
MEMLATAAAIYWIMSIVFELIQSRLERRFGQGYRR